MYTSLFFDFVNISLSNLKTSHKLQMLANRDFALCNLYATRSCFALSRRFESQNYTNEKYLALLLRLDIRLRSVVI